jgi:hypothetical protein
MEGIQGNVMIVQKELPENDMQQFPEMLECVYRVTKQTLFKVTRATRQGNLTH